ncbi:hypothetical protein [Motilibacter aurantiacus]|uniref:hypothetical protein n=1 Tax=Motilibacter aurantiacus TaxID=2714955 RepID=UPI00140837B7|nr:hypothetical protein [Motilibacter aurantiacus]NHC43793.1 hypothetical protein [Motilibacter aurantiacus]
MATGRPALAPAGRIVVGASALHADRHLAEHLLEGLLGAVAATGAGAAGAVACTHLVAAPHRHEAVSVEVGARPGPAVDAVALAERLGPEAGVVVVDSSGARQAAGPAAQVAAALEAASAHATRSGGRAVVFPGQESVTGDMPVSELLALTAIDRVRSSQGAYAPEAVVVTRGYVRPQYADGRLVLLCEHADPTRLLPWEIENPAVCGGH